jgi:LysR substrate binding domain
MVHLLRSEDRDDAPERTRGLVIMSSRGVLDAVRAHRTEIGFVEGRGSREADESFTIARDQLSVLVSSGRPWARWRTVTTRDLGAGPYLTREGVRDTRGSGERPRACRGRLVPAIQAWSSQTVKRAVAYDGGRTCVLVLIDTAGPAELNLPE